MAVKFAYIDTENKKIGPFDPIVASIPADIAGYYFAIATDEPTPKYGLVPDVGVLKYSSETVLDTGNQTTTGIKLSRTYKLPIPANMIIAGRIWLFGKSGAFNETANTGDKARVNLDLRKNGSAISGVTKATGTERVPNNTAECNYSEILAVDLPATEFSVGDTLDIVVELEITAVDATNPGITFKLYCDPGTEGNELVFYLQVS